MWTSAFQTMKVAIVSATDLSRDALHVHVGLAVMIGTALILRKSLGSLLPWLAAAVAASAGEALDMWDDMASLGRWRWDAGLHDLVNTLFWPTILLLFARARLGPSSAGPVSRELRDCGKPPRD